MIAQRIAVLTDNSASFGLKLSGPNNNKYGVYTLRLDNGSRYRTEGRVVSAFQLSQEIDRLWNTLPDPEDSEIISQMISVRDELRKIEN